jgi:hypothetical protein
MRSRGSYLGTLRLDQPWYSRTLKRAGFPEKGAGDYWYDYRGFYFVRKGSGEGLLIPTESIVKVTIGYWHGLTFPGTRILKIIWRTGREQLSSGFVVSHPDQVKEALTAMGWA